MNITNVLVTCFKIPRPLAFLIYLGTLQGTPLNHACVVQRSRWRTIKVELQGGLKAWDIFSGVNLLGFVSGNHRTKSGDFLFEWAPGACFRASSRTKNNPLQADWLSCHLRLYPRKSLPAWQMRSIQRFLNKKKVAELMASAMAGRRPIRAMKSGNGCTSWSVLY